MPFMACRNNVGNNQCCLSNECLWCPAKQANSCRSILLSLTTETAWPESRNLSIGHKTAAFVDLDLFPETVVFVALVCGDGESHWALINLKDEI